MGVFDFIAQVLKLVAIIIKHVKNGKAENEELFKKRLAMVSEVLNKITEDNYDEDDEDSFLDNLDWETSERYNTYKEIALDILSRGEGYSEMTSNIIMGFGNRVKLNRDKVVEILSTGFIVETKASKIAQLLIS